MNNYLGCILFHMIYVDNLVLPLDILNYLKPVRNTNNLLWPVSLRSKLVLIVKWGNGHQYPLAGVEQRGGLK